MAECGSLSPKCKNAIFQLPRYGLVLRARRSPSPNRKTKLRHGHGVSCGLPATAESLVKYKLVCYWLVYWNLKFIGQHLLAQSPHWRKVSAGPGVTSNRDFVGGSRMVVKQFQDGGWPPFWKSIYRHISVKNHPIFMKFCTQQQILNWMNVTWSKHEKVEWTDSEFDRTYFLFEI